ncbi:uncharacterized protein [Palaemon carinicauda]|uniref:uncharacterized protein n=1 Tax=Palaemon carinicauda TaxID=392227 RepID=UPI0035B60F91
MKCRPRANSQKTRTSATYSIDLRLLISQDPNRWGFYLRDAVSGRIMLVDNGGLHSTFPTMKEYHGNPIDSTVQLVAANGSPLHCYGTRTLKISIMGHSYIWTFIIADVNWEPIYWPNTELLVDVGRKRLLNTGHVVLLTSTTSSGILTLDPPTHVKFRQLRPQELHDAKNTFTDMEWMGICKKVAVLWASAFQMVKKPNGIWRPCGTIPAST